MKARNITRRVLTGGYLPSRRAQREYQAGFDRYIAMMRLNALPPSYECEVCGCPLPAGLVCGACLEDAR